ncbi:MAE_28990/MAE_18760 family HEPN-like nuclease [Curvibacter gracilis]|uniref:MAE_28990/MAE_18760 family HEPN-like nuclease n=1 Tax=Curvibacter gracilis TaxID=230310 RepID=UPI001B805D8A|nr:MAE_28990/MAE_18760 family HEPN-like nuclease [Curvibacter gracilis]
MSKIRTLSDLQDHLDRAIAWRLKEIAYVKSSAKSAKSYAQAALVRAGLPLVYAHWEGFVKQASEFYLEYVDNQGLKYSELATCFFVFGIKKHVATLIDSRQAVANIEAVDFIRKAGEQKASLTLSNAINTASNLSSLVFFNIASSLGISLDAYHAYSNFIDKSLVDRRNKIAHGEYLDLDAESFEGISEQVLVLMRMYKNDVENLASMSAYRIPP